MHQTTVRRTGATVGMSTDEGWGLGCGVQSEWSHQFKCAPIISTYLLCLFWPQRASLSHAVDYYTEVTFVIVVQARHQDEGWVWRAANMQVAPTLQIKYALQMSTDPATPRPRLHPTDLFA